MLAGCLEKNDVNDYRVFIKRFILLVDLAGTGNWQEGERFSSGVSSDDVSTWISGLNL